MKGSGGGEGDVCLDLDSHLGWEALLWTVSVASTSALSHTGSHLMEQLKKREI